MDIEIGGAGPVDEAVCGRIDYDAFKVLADRHLFTSVFSPLEAAMRVVLIFFGLETMWSAVAEVGGRVVGTIFSYEGDPIHGVALVSVDPGEQRRGVGRRLMDAALARATSAAGVRLIQEAFNVHALGLYTSLGFEVKAGLARIVGRPGPLPHGVDVQMITHGDVDECDHLYTRVQGWSRGVDLRDALGQFTGYAAVRGGRIVACTYVLYAGVLAWAVAETDDDMMALLTGVGSAVKAPVGVNAPTHTAFFRRCLELGFRIEKPLTLMARGGWREPRGCYIPSGIY